MDHPEDRATERALKDAATVHAVRMELRPLVEEVVLGLADDPLQDQLAVSVNSLGMALKSARAAQGRAAHRRMTLWSDNTVGRSS
jgi:hypothetical protein